MTKKRAFTHEVMFCLICLFFSVTYVSAADSVDQIITHVDDIIKANPLKPGEKLQMIKVAEDDSTTIYMARLVDGAEVKPHFHKTHSETVYVLKGSGQQMINGQWIDIRPGSFHFNPMTKIHSTRNTGKGEMVIFSIFTPAMKMADREYVK